MNIWCFIFSLAAGYYVISIFDVFLSSVNKQFWKQKIDVLEGGL